MKIKVLFVCHGNICRSPMAEFVFRDMVQKMGVGEFRQGISLIHGTPEILSKPMRIFMKVVKLFCSHCAKASYPVRRMKASSA